MPSAQVIDFGEDPYANAMGGFAKNFLGTLNEKTAQRRNENIFSKIKAKYGPDAKKEDIFRDVLEAEGLDQEYKRNKLNEIKDYATLSTKDNTTPYQKAMLEIRGEELGLKKDKNKEDSIQKNKDFKLQEESHKIRIQEITARQKNLEKEHEIKREVLEANLKEAENKRANLEKEYALKYEFNKLDQAQKKEFQESKLKHSQELSKLNLDLAEKKAALSTQLMEQRLALEKLKADGEKIKAITPYQEKVLQLQEVRLANDRERIDNAVKTQDKKLPEHIDKYTGNLLKNAEVKLPAHDKADLNSFIEQLMTEDGLGINEAFNKAYDYIEARREKIETVEITPRPSSWLGTSPKQVGESLEKAYQELKALHDEDGIDNQKELRGIAERGGWTSEEITQMLRRIFQGAGKRLKESKKQPSAQASAQIPFEEQGQASQAAGIDDILFGE